MSKKNQDPLDLEEVISSDKEIPTTPLQRFLQNLEIIPLIILAIGLFMKYKGLEYSSELKERMLNEAETASVFSVLMSIKWPEGQTPENLNFKSNVNLFRNVFYHLSDDPLLMKSYQADKSYLYNLESGQMEVYQCIDENGKYGYIKVD